MFVRVDEKCALESVCEGGDKEEKGRGGGSEALTKTRYTGYETIGYRLFHWLLSLLPKGTQRW